MPIAPSHLKRLQNEPSKIRNICILAHVDHGKTSLSDCLLASNGIISQKLAGKVRYLDSRPDEQMRGITMESSAISLYFRVLTKVSDSEEPLAEEHLINLIDSPGHIDFSSEVSTASRLCDGAVVLVDAVEGVCSQTVTVLRQTWIEKLRPMIVINKIDRLIVELQLTPLEAYNHLTKLIEQVNVVMSSFFTGQRMADDLKWREQQENNIETIDSNTFVESSDDDIYFSPEKMNVIFASAIDGWGFNISQFAAIYERKLGMKRENLEKVLWGDFYLDPKTKKIINSKGLKGRNLKPLFVSLILDNIWAIYDSTVISRNPEKSEKIIKALGLKIAAREISSKDGKSLLNSMLGQWIPLSSAVLLTVIKQLPSPLVAQTDRIASILDAAPGSDEISPDLREAMIACDRTGPVSAYISKVIAVPENELPRNKRAEISMEELRERGRQAREAAVAAAEAAEAAANGASFNSPINNDYTDYDYDFESTTTTETKVPDVKEMMIGFGRVYSGTLRVGQELLILGPKYHPSRPKEFVSKVTITELYLLMGRELVALDEAPAGNIVGIGGLDGKILKNGTLVSMDYRGANLAGINMSAPPIVRVALEPTNPTQLDRLELGLKLLNQSDPCVKILVQETGEHVMITAGELHLERCLKDLRERFAKIEIQASNPIVPYRETIVPHPVAENAADAAPMKNPELGRGVVEVEVGHVKLKLRMIPLPKKVTMFLHEHKLSITNIVSARRRIEADIDTSIEVDIVDANTEDVEFNEITKALNLEEFTSQLRELFDKAVVKDDPNAALWSNAVDRIAAFGPRRAGPNLLLDCLENPILKHLLNYRTEIKTSEFEDSINTGFQLAMAHGPLCAEQVEGVACIVESVTVDPDMEQVAGISGRLITATRDALHQCFLDWSPRLMLAMYVCDIQATTEVLGKVYGVVTKRRGRIVSEEMKEGTPFFFIKALMPVVEAFGFADDIRKKTSGAASPQLIFSGFQILDEDPFWVPTTEEELEDLGDTADRENIAKKYVDAIRTRKGLFVEKKLVDNAERQRTLKK
ncbi:P-loop containing nucleoside triphosphate hydrolase protein [Nadsonia fulvescens var. elongata DSM 6958]|uniref:Ribosome assembly protein 1 n=1 Tax=Nadsonia fulvescens var. elongata DSM 6958 TaxID=857566 RepID=A0A1E3PDC0_9ASCO|nr:P-loop containing nucleoside triphosphate hydrolase protein [Nadsonia fulvescens var. elongata DSM 6958]